MQLRVVFTAPYSLRLIVLPTEHPQFGFIEACKVDLHFMLSNFRTLLAKNESRT